MKVGVLGLGNVLMGDDGLGPVVIQHLQAAYEFSEDVVVEDLGTPGLDLIPFLIDLDAVIFVDVVKSEGEAGELRVYHTDDILRHAPNPRMTPHDPGVKSALISLRLAGVGPTDATLVGVIPRQVEAGLGLTPAVRAAVPLAAALVLAELARLGILPDYRQTCAPAPAWYQQIALNPQ